MKKVQNRFSIVNAYKKPQSIEVLSQLSSEQLINIINLKDKDVLLNIINHALTKSDLQDILFKSDIADETLLEYLQKNDNNDNI